MEHSVYLAQLLGPVLLLLGVAYAFRINDFEKIIKDFMKDSGLIHVSVILMMLGGLAIILTHNVWVWSWPLIITILGWGVLLKGLIFAFAPKGMMKMTEKVMHMRWLFVFGVMLWVVFGLALTYYGYFA